jgi:hypothetical protein
MYITLTYPKNFDTSWAWVNDKITLKQTRNKNVISSFKISSDFIQSCCSWKFKGNGQVYIITEITLGRIRLTVTVNFLIQLKHAYRNTFDNGKISSSVECERNAE